MKKDLISIERNEYMLQYFSPSAVSLTNMEQRCPKQGLYGVDLSAMISCNIIIFCRKERYFVQNQTLNHSTYGGKGVWNFIFFLKIPVFENLTDAKRLIFVEIFENQGYS